VIAVDRPGDLGFDAARLGRIRAWMKGYVSAGRFPFACTVIARRGEIAYCDYLGERDLAAGTPYELDTIVRVYSMTKPITTVALLMLYEEGLLHLDDPLAAFLPGFDIDLYVSTDLKTMTAIWMGVSKVKQEIEVGSLVLTGNRGLARRMQTWLGLSPFAVEPKRVSG
jgi:CubicO group peptidase (beta-lactamase class C family)